LDRIEFLGFTFLKPWYRPIKSLFNRAEKCGLMFDDRTDARNHEGNCDAEGPSYIH